MNEKTEPLGHQLKIESDRLKVVGIAGSCMEAGGLWDGKGAEADLRSKQTLWNGMTTLSNVGLRYYYGLVHEVECIFPFFKT
jgi:hypothetical protein